MKRTKIVIFFVTFFIVCIFISESSPSDKKAKTQTKDDIEEHYIFTQWSINQKILNKYFELKMIAYDYKLNYQRQRMHDYNSRKSQELRIEAEKIEERKRDIKNKIDELKDEKNILELDALKYYKGKLPKTFIKKWNKNEDELFSKTSEFQDEELEIINSVNE